MLTTVTKFWREWLLMAAIVALSTAVYNYIQTRDRFTAMEAKYEATLEQMKALDSTRLALSDSVADAKEDVKAATEKYEAAKRRAKGTIVYVPRTLPTPNDTGTRIVDSLPPDSLVAIPVLEHPEVKAVLIAAEARIAQGDSLIGKLELRVHVDSSLIEKQRQIIKTLSIPPKKPNKLTRLVTHVGLGVGGAFIGQKVKGTTGLVLGGLLGSVSASLF